MLGNEAWVLQQRDTFIRWANIYLHQRYIHLSELSELRDGIVWATLMELTLDKRVPVNLFPKHRMHKIENWQINLDTMKREGLKLESMSATSLVDGNEKLMLGLLWSYILRIPIMCESNSLCTLYSYDGLLRWLRELLPSHTIGNFSNDWKDGKLLCYLVNEFAPGTFNLPSGFSEDSITNARMGLEKAQELLSIPPILQPEDFAMYPSSAKIAPYLCSFGEYEKKKVRMNVIQRETARTVNLIMLMEHLPFCRLPRSAVLRIGLFSHTFYEPYTPLEFRPIDSPRY